MSDERRTGIVTGSASGLGRALAVRFAPMAGGWRWPTSTSSAIGRPCNWSNRRAAKDVASGSTSPIWTSGPALHDRLRTEWTQLDLLANNAGVAGAGDVGRFPMAEWRRLLEVNLFGVIHGCHVFVEWLKSHPGRSQIINTASAAAFAAAPSMAAYNVSKAGVLAISETLCAELRPYGVGVTVLCPGFFLTGLVDQGHFEREEQRQLALERMQLSSLTADSVAEFAVQAMRRRKLYVVVGRRARWLWRLKRWCPVLYLTLMSAAYGRELPPESSPSPRL